jgi:hypothetical protein
MLCGCIPSPGGRGLKVRDLVQRAIFSARDLRFRIRILYSPPSNLCVIPTEAEGPRIRFSGSARLIAVVATAATDKKNLLCVAGTHTDGFRRWRVVVKRITVFDQHAY